MQTRASSRKCRPSRASCEPPARRPGDGCDLNGLCGADRVSGRKSPLFPAYGDLDVAGPRIGLPRSYPDRGGPVHQQRRENLMRRASTCLAVLGLAVLGACAARRGLGGADGHVQSQGGADPRLPAHRQHLRRRRAVEAEYKISGTEYGGFPPPLTRVNFYLPAGTKLHPSGFPTCPVSTLEPSGKGPSGCPKGSVGRSRSAPVKASSPSVKKSSPRKSRSRLLRAGRRADVLHVRPRTGAAGNPLEGRTSPARAANSARSSKLKCRWSKRCRARRMPRSASSRSRAAPPSRKARRSMYYGTLPTKCPKSGFPVKTRTDVRRSRRPHPADGHGRHTRRRARQEVGQVVS